MYGTLAIRRGRKFWASRGTALAAIALLHLGGFLLALLHRVSQPDPAPALLSVSLLTPEQARVVTPAPRAPQPRLEVPARAVLLPPEFATEATEVPPARAITAAVLPPASTAAPAPIESEVSAPLLVSRAEYLRAPVLRYPPAALAARREGSVGLRVLVGEDGRVLDVAVERSSGFAPFDEAACAAVRAALFRPYRVNGVARTVLIRIPVDFTLKRRAA